VNDSERVRFVTVRPNGDGLVALDTRGRVWSWDYDPTFGRRWVLLGSPSEPEPIDPTPIGPYVVGRRQERTS